MVAYNKLRESMIDMGNLQQVGGKPKYMKGVYKNLCFKIYLRFSNIINCLISITVGLTGRQKLVGNHVP